jgi:hypothetical protein
MAKRKGIKEAEDVEMGDETRRKNKDEDDSDSEEVRCPNEHLKKSLYYISFVQLTCFRLGYGDGQRRL